MSEDPDFEMEVVETGTPSLSHEGQVDSEGSKSASHDGKSEHGFLVGDLPEDWKVSRLQGICEINPDSFSPDDEEGTFEYISLSDASDGVILGSESIPVEEAPSRAKRRVKQGDVLVGTVRPKQSSHGFVTPEHDRKVCSSGFGVLRTSQQLNSHFLRQEVLSRRFFRQMMAYVAGSGYPAVKLSDLDKHRVAVPDLPEQRKIASVLYAVDQAIQKTEEIIDQAKRVKRGLMQSLMSQGLYDHELVDTSTRFGRLPSTWRVAKLEEVGRIAGRTAPEKEDEECWGGDIPWATPSEITNLEGNTIRATKEYLTDRALEKVSSNLLPSGSILLTTRATVGACAVNIVPMTTNQGFKNVVPGDDLNTWYGYYRLTYESDQLEARAKGSTFREVGKETVEKFEIPIPPIEEQEEIGRVLKSIDDRILNDKEMAKGLERLKAGLMQDLLTGEVRTTDKAIEILEEVQAHG